MNDKPRSVYINGKCFQCKKFQSLRSISTWAGRWYVKKDRANYYLKRLKKLGYIRIENMRFTTRITVLEAQRFLYLGSDSYNESVNGFATAKNKKSQRITGSKQERSSEVVNGKKNENSTKQENYLVHTGKNLKGNSSSSLNELQKEKLILEFYEKEKKDFEKNRKQANQCEVERLPIKINPEQKPTPKSEKSEPLTKHFFSYPEPLCTIEFKEQPESWEQNIAELERFFKTVTLPGNPVRLNGCEVITDIKEFVNSHLAIVKAQNGNPTYKPYIERLIELKEILTKNLN
ncbi:hypothetical protein ES705_08203 [subsurface metagenome]